MSKSKQSFFSKAGSWLGLAKPTSTSPATSPVRVKTKREARSSGLSQPAYLANSLDINRVNASLRAAERGDVWQLFTLFRDMCSSYGHLQSEWAKRKAVITGNTETLIPHDPENKEDVVACEVIKQMIDNCRNWYDALNHLMDATLWPLAAAEKIFEPVGLAETDNHKYPLRYRLKEIAPIDPTLLCFKLPYVPSFISNDVTNRYDPDDWEAWLRFYSTNENGSVKYSMDGIYRPNIDEHIVHRGNMLSPVIPPNFGGHLRTILFPWLLSTQGRDWFSLFMQKYGMPIGIAKVNSQQKETVAAMQEALALCSQLGGIVIDAKAKLEFAQVNTTQGADAHKVFQEWCDSQTSRIVVGQAYSASPKNTGMGSGAAAQSEEIREDIRKQDTRRLSDTLRNQLFKQFLRINGYKGSAPRIVWGGMRSGEATTFSTMLASQKSAGLIPTERGLRTINESLGIEFEIDKNATGEGTGRATNAVNQKGSNPNKVKY